MKHKRHDPIPTNKHPRGYHGGGNNFISIQEWEQIKFSNMWIRRPIVGIVELALE